MKSLEELRAIKEKMQSQVNMRKPEDKTTRIVVGMATCGIAAGARPVLNTFSDLIQQNKLDSVEVTQTGCVGLCQYEPIVEVYEKDKEKVTYIKMDAERAKEIFEEHIKKGKIVQKYTISTASLK
ncbi:ferredoxin [Clostridia bacterium]|nr:ferredoxin [Clostridia bacterium]